MSDEEDDEVTQQDSNDFDNEDSDGSIDIVIVPPRRDLAREKELANFSEFLKVMNTYERAQMKEFLVKPLPPNVLFLCRIRREGSLITRMFPKFIMEADNGVFLLAAKKRVKSKTSNFLLSCDANDLTREGDNYVGKVRSNFLRTEYTSYSAGYSQKKILSPRSKTTVQSSKSVVSADLREETAAIQFKPHTLRKKGITPRQILVTLPYVDPQSGCRYECKEENLLSLAEHYSQTSVREDDKECVTTYVTKNPTWCRQLQSYTLNFNGRVTEASIKNFQLVRTEDANETFLQFGRVSKDTFNLDIRHPFSVCQAFAIALSLFDYKLQ
eukprot:GEMP01016466.1.p1 GENE.GEMP01016466.1~~GEMP01016466.1.p1  ORF type:complete len:327 (+),score=67.85 GEMP01016466.1:236-1216(+)